ncbi:MAG: allantoinase PuuE [Proteobacteria bacterium]|nr:allantoinase PuuE [Pseudomonadota bacterium]
MSSDYPRDLFGYGRSPPHARWPRDARIAVQFVINYEEGGENCILHGDAASEAFLSEIIGAQPWPGQRHMNMESIYEYGARAGYWRLWRMFTDRQMPVSVFAIATAMARCPDVVASMREAGWEIATHGLKWIDYRDVKRVEERAHIVEAIRIHAAVAGARPLGFYQGRCSPHTLNIVMEEQGFLYSADSYADELPYWIDGPHGPHLIVPYTLDANDMRFATAQGFNCGEQFFSYLKDSFDVLYAEGTELPKMLSVGLHCRLAGRPGRAAALARFLDYVQGHDKVWVATRLDIARHWIASHPPAGGYRPSRMARALFVERFSDVLAHAPHIAARVHAAGLTSANDSPAGLHDALVAVLRNLSDAEKLSLIRAQTDVAGRPQGEGAASIDPIAERTVAGFFQLGDDERQRLTALGDAYWARFGIPLIADLRAENNADILKALAARLGNDASAEFSEALRQIERLALLWLREHMAHCG